MVSFPASVFKEIQRLLFFVCNDLYFAKGSMREDAGTNFLEKKGMVNGSYIRDQMVIVMRTLKKATAYGKEYLDSKGNGPSGGNEHDYHKYVLDKMYIEWRIQCQRDKATRDKAARKKNGIPEPPGSEVHIEQAIATERPEQWIFPGYMAFVLFGHYGSSKCNTLLTSKCYVDSCVCILSFSNTLRPILVWLQKILLLAQVVKKLVQQWLVQQWQSVPKWLMERWRIL
jgi:hypothetical protein